MVRVKIPLTGTLTSYDPPLGDDNDPVRPVNISLGNVAWTLIDLDLDNDLAEIEITPSDGIDEQTGVDGEGKPIYIRRPTTAEERVKLLEDIQTLLSRPATQLYMSSGSAKLKKPPRK